MISVSDDNNGGVSRLYELYVVVGAACTVTCFDNRFSFLQFELMSRLDLAICGSCSRSGRRGPPSSVSPSSFSCIRKGITLSAGLETFCFCCFAGAGFCFPCACFCCCCCTLALLFRLALGVRSRIGWAMVIPLFEGTLGAATFTGTAPDRVPSITLRYLAAL